MSRRSLPQPSDLTWQGQAACRADDVEADWFFPAQDNGPSLAKARSVRAGCWVKRGCLAYALAVEGGQPAKTREGVYAGTTGNQRYDLYRKARDRAKKATA